MAGEARITAEDRADTMALLTAALEVGRQAHVAQELGRLMIEVAEKGRLAFVTFNLAALCLTMTKAVGEQHGLTIEEYLPIVAARMAALDVDGPPH